MPHFKTIPTIGGIISIWQITETPEELIAFFTAGELERDGFSKFTFGKRQTEWLATRVLLKQLIGSDFQIAYTATGKPLLQHPVYHHISITHSREFVAVFVHQFKEIGIDIESQQRNYTPILKKYLSEGELCHMSENPLVPCLYWCAKEALFKLVEEQGIDFKKQFEILWVRASGQQLLARYRSAQQVKTYQLSYMSLNDHCLVWVSDDPLESGQLNEWPVD